MRIADGGRFEALWRMHERAVSGAAWSKELARHRLYITARWERVIRHATF